MIGNPYAQKNFGREPQEEEDLYVGYDQIASTETIHKTITTTNNASNHGTSNNISGYNPFAPSQQQPSVRPPTTTFGVGMQSEIARPMTAVQSAGYSSKQPRWDPLNQSMGKSSSMFTLKEEKKKQTPEETARKMEKEVHDLFLQSTEAHNAGDYSRALERASQAVKKERTLTKHRDKSQLGEQVNMDLTYAVRFNLARQYHASGMYDEALSAYSQIVKNKQYPYLGRLRVNMGNIYYEQKKYAAAKRMYRMAMDQISTANQSSRETRFRIMQNIGNALGQYQEAIESFESVMNSYPNTTTGFNLLLCHYSRGNIKKMKLAFTALLAVNTNGSARDSDDEEEEDNPLSDQKMSVPGGRDMKGMDGKDDLKAELSARRAHDERLVYRAARLIAPVIEPSDFAAGYKWVIGQLREPARDPDGNGEGKPLFPRLAMEMEIALGTAYLKRKDISRAIQTFKDFERKEAALLDQAATNLSFLYFLEGDLKNAEVYAEKAVRADRYNAKALVNKANFMFKQGYLDGAKELYLEAIGVEADCVEAIYNLGLVNKRLGNLKASLMAFSKLHRIVPKDPMVIYQIANLYDMMEDSGPATKWFKILHGAIPTDPTILYRIGALHKKGGDDTAAFHNYSDSYNVYPVNMDIISWLGVWFVKSNLYERAIPFFERAAEIEPDEIKWKLMVASCYRRMSAFTKSLKCYRAIHKQDPDNAECLRYMCQILKEMHRDEEYAQCAELLHKAERAAAHEHAMSQNRFMQDDLKDGDMDMHGQERVTTPNASPRHMGDDGILGTSQPPPPSPSPSTDMWNNNVVENDKLKEDVVMIVKSRRRDDSPTPENKVANFHQQPRSFGNDEVPVGGGAAAKKGRGGVLVQLDNDAPATPGKKKKKPSLKKKKSVAKKKKKAAEEEDEWGDFDLGMEGMLPETL